MAKKQTRRSISLRGATYAAVFADCTGRQVSVSDYLEQLIAADRAARGLSSTAAPSRKLALLIASAERESVRLLERAIAAVRAIPSESSIAVGPPPEQTAMLGRVETPRRAQPLRAVQVSAAHREAMRPIPPIRSGFEPARSQEHTSARPTHGDRVAPPVPGRGPTNVVSF